MINEITACYILISFAYFALEFVPLEEESCWFSKSSQVKSNQTKTKSKQKQKQNKIKTKTKPKQNQNKNQTKPKPSRTQITAYLFINKIILSLDFTSSESDSVSQIWAIILHHHPFSCVHFSVSLSDFAWLCFFFLLSLITYKL